MSHFLSQIIITNNIYMYTCNVDINLSSLVFSRFRWENFSCMNWARNIEVTTLTLYLKSIAIKMYLSEAATSRDA